MNKYLDQEWIQHQLDAALEERKTKFINTIKKDNPNVLYIWTPEIEFLLENTYSVGFSDGAEESSKIVSNFAKEQIRKLINKDDSTSLAE